MVYTVVGGFDCTLLNAVIGNLVSLVILHLFISDVHANQVFQIITFF